MNRLRDTRYFVGAVLKLAGVLAIGTAIVVAVILQRPGPDADKVMKKVVARLAAATGVVCNIDTDLPGRPDAIVYEDTDRGQRQDHIRGKKLISRSIADFTAGTQHFLDYERRLYYENPLSEKEREELKTITRPLEMVRTFFEKGEIVRLGREAVDGIDCYGFEVTYSLGDRSSMGAGIISDRIWVDTGSFWPVRLESDVAGAIQSPVPDWKMWLSDFRWNPTLADTVFAVEIPDDFQVVTREYYRAQISGE